MLHRNKKKNDENEGKWIGVGGHIEPGESILGCLKREVKEETGYTVKKARYLGKIDFLNDRYPCERMYLYAVPEFEGEERVCDEGELAWINKNDILDLPLWEGDKAFLPLLESEEKSPFHLILLYSGYDLAEVLGPAYPPKKKKKKTRRRA
ncbi:MAG: 8-oxo-dGTP diphosphatase [Bacilli bacterium]|nr:8-oxo-dGTP diphosphatase [Bacilli bacterium]